MEDDSSLVIHEFIDKYDDSSYKMSSSKNSKKANKKKTSTKESRKTGSPQKRKRKPKPPDMPRRPLSAYNIFFQEQRALIIGKPVSTESVSGISRCHNTEDGIAQGQKSFARKKRAHRRTHGKISFANLAKQIGAAWNSLSTQEKKKYNDGAAKEKARYQEELRIYKLKKKKEGEEQVLGNKISTRIREGKEVTTTDYQARSGKRRKKYRTPSDQDKDCSSGKRDYVRDTPAGLTIEYDARKPPSRLRGRRYCPMYLGHTIKTEEVDSIYPLPLTFDASRCHPSEIVNDQEMMQVMSPLLNHPPPKQQIFRQASRDYYYPYEPHPSIKCEENSSSIPCIQTTLSNISACSGKSCSITNKNSSVGPDNEMADILTFFLKDGDVEKDNSSSSKRSSAHVETTSDIYAI